MILHHSKAGEILLSLGGDKSKVEAEAAAADEDAVRRRRRRVISTTTEEEKSKGREEEAEVSEAQVSEAQAMTLALLHAAENELMAEHKAGMLTHMCEYMLLIDKIKEPLDIFSIWNKATASEYQNFSLIFLFDKAKGWGYVLEEQAGIGINISMSSINSAAAAAAASSAQEDEQRRLRSPFTANINNTKRRVELFASFFGGIEV